MHTQGVPKKLQKAIIKYFVDHDYGYEFIATALNVNEKTVRYSLDPKLGREVTYNLIGLVAVHMPGTWQAIARNFISEKGN